MSLYFRVVKDIGKEGIYHRVSTVETDTNGSFTISSRSLRYQKKRFVASVRLSPSVESIKGHKRTMAHYNWPHHERAMEYREIGEVLLNISYVFRLLVDDIIQAHEMERKRRFCFQFRVVNGVLR